MEILDYNIVKSKVLDKTKSYYNIHYKSIILFTNYEAVQYNIATRYNKDTKQTSIYIILYKEPNPNGINLVRDYSHGYKIYVPKSIIRSSYNSLVYNVFRSNEDINVKVELIEERTIPECIIYSIDAI